MKLLWLELKNFCQHKNLRVTFTDGLNALIGPNGSGKSNLLEGIYFAFTGDIRNPGNLEDNIHDLKLVSHESYVKLAFSHGMYDYTITRKLDPSSAMIVTDNGLETRGARNMAPYMEKVLGLSKKMLSDFIFIEQQELANFFSLKPAERALAMQSLFGIRHAEKCYEELGDYIRNLEVPIPKVDAAALKEKIQISKSRIKELRTEIKNISLPDDWSESSDPDYLVLRDLEKKISLEQHIKVESNTYKEFNLEVENLVPLVDKYKASIKQSKYELDKIDSKALERDLINLENYEKNTALRDKLEETYSLLEQEAETYSLPDKPTSYLEPGDFISLNKAVGKLRNDITYLEEYLSTFSETGKVVCPKCGSSLSSEDIYKKKQEYEELINKLSLYEDRINQTRNYENQVEKYNIWLDSYSVRSQALLDQYSTLSLSGAESLPSLSKEEIFSLLVRADEFTEEIEKYRSLLSDVDVTIGIITGKIQTLETSLNTKKEELSRLDISSERVEQSQKSIIDKKKLYEHRLRLYAELNYLDRHLPADEKSLMEANRLLSKAKNIHTFAKTLMSVRGILHKDCLPKLVSQTYLESLDQDINKVLSELGQTFYIKTDENLGFQAQFVNGTSQPDTRLSVGQQSMLAMALRIVINATFASDIGLLCLDEPTDGLDKDNMHGFEVALARLSQLSKSSGLQCLLATHEQALSHLFDNVISLKIPS